jgi:galactokinase
MLNEAERHEYIVRLFRSKFGADPELWACAPGRVDLMGSHTDYNLGHVLTVAVNRDTWMAARPTNDETVRVYSANLHAQDRFSLPSIERIRGKCWSNYIRGVASVLEEQGLRLSGFDGVVHSTVPLESGLSSSAALECATAVLFRELGGWDLKPEEMAQLCQKAENQFVGVKCGILDPWSSCLGRKGCILLLDCRSLSTRTIPLAPGIEIVICDTREPRRVADDEYALRRAQCEEAAARLGLSALRDVTLQQLEARANELPAPILKRARFIVMENARVQGMAEALAAGDRTAIARLCAESSGGARDLYEIYSPAMLAMRESMMTAPGVIGARQAGAGFGGCMVALVEAEHTEEFQRAVLEAYQKATGIQPETYRVEAAAGAGLLGWSQRLLHQTSGQLSTESR